MLKIYSVSLGCPKNRVDTEHLLAALDTPFRLTPQLGRADLVFINTCGFITSAVRESVRTILDAAGHIAGLRRKPLLVVAGCMVGRYGARELAAELPEVDLWLPNQQLARWPELLAARLGIRAKEEGRLVAPGTSYAWLKISDGCRHLCAFCTIPSIRGVHRSVPADRLVREARALLDCGVQELVLVAQDLTAWGEDLHEKYGLRTLLERLLPLSGLTRLRLLYLYPAGIRPELLSFMKSAGAPLLPYFDVPLQHAHHDVLQRMGRPFAGNPRLVVERIREVFPDAALRTSLITGFPGETDEQFETLRAFVEWARFTHLGVFAYEQEEGTAAAAMPGQVAASVRQQRRNVLMEIQAEISADFLLTQVGKRLPVLVDAPQGDWPGLHIGRTWFQAPEIDGVTYISGPGVAPGKLVDADIVESASYDLTALA